MASEIRNIALWQDGELKIEWVRRHMPLLDTIQKQFAQTQPFKGLKIALSVHLEAKTAHLCEVLASGGAEMYVTGSNPLSTQDDIAAALVHEGLNVFALHGATPEEYMRGIRKVLEAGPNVIIDDGGDLVTTLHNEYPELIPNVLGGCEETTTGILRLKAMDRAGQLRFPMMLVNDADCKHLFDNRYGTGQSVWDGINRTTNLIVAGKSVVVAGYGWCGKGVAMRAKGMGAKVIVTEVDPIKAMEAVMDGFRVMTMRQAAPLGDIFVTVTGCKEVISTDDFLAMKDGAICCNAGHFDVEVSIADLKKMAVRTAPARNNIEAYTLPDGKIIYIIAEGRLVNLAAGDGHPAEIMDMSFAIQALSAEWLVRNHASLSQKPGEMLHNVPVETDRRVAELKLADWGIEIDH
ncbi:MAG: adenosylhomocysteinase, partial [Oscillospiraceae bacterium]|nr:adenosylhomocysteinase [Oscillospiraceae bacterium]